MQAGAARDVRDSAGRSPLQLAEQAGHHAAALALRGPERASSGGRARPNGKPTKAQQQALLQQQLEQPVNGPPPAPTTGGAPKTPGAAGGLVPDDLLQAVVQDKTNGQGPCGAQLATWLLSGGNVNGLSRTGQVRRPSHTHAHAAAPWLNSSACVRRR